MTGGPLLRRDLVGERGENGLPERRRLSGELQAKVSVGRNGEHGTTNLTFPTHVTRL
jgi:hypothetical protein